MAFAEWAATLTETDRKKLSKSAQELLQQARPSERANHDWPTHEGHMARLALLAVGPRSQTCRPMNLDQRPNMPSMSAFRAVPGPNPYEEAAVKMLADRRPDWADEWLILQIAEQDRSLSWETVRRLIREGVCRKPDSAAYLRLVSDFGRFTDFDQDPEVLEDAWKLLRTPTHAFSLRNYPKQEAASAWAESPGQTWPQIFYYYAYHGRFERGRLIDELLKALWLEFAPSEHTGLMDLHDMLGPTEDELLKRQLAYIALLRNAAASVVNFALKVIKSLANANAFDADAAMSELPAVFEVAAKAQPKSALSLAMTLARNRPHLKTFAIDAALRALSHSESDVQLAAIKCLETWRNDGLPRERLAELRSIVSLVVQPRLAELLSGLTDASLASGEHAEAEVGEPLVPLSDLRERIALISPGLKAAWRLEDSLSACEAGEIPPPADIDASPTVLAGLGEVAPITDVEELIDAVSQVLERIDSPMEIERILDGLSRLGRQRPADFMIRTNALRRRIREIDTQMRPNSLLAARFMFPTMFGLLGDWLGVDGGVQPDWPRRSFFQYPTSEAAQIFQVLTSRAAFIRVKWNDHAECAPLLSFPTHDHGWIDPRAFVERLRQFDLSELETRRVDFRYGLLRLAPDFREEAMREAAGLPQPIHRIVCYALGREASITSDDRDWKAEWLAAGRVRSPRGQLDELAPLDLPPAANAVVPAQFHVHLERLPADSEERKYQFYVETEPFVDVEPALPTDLNVAEYPVLVVTQRLAGDNDYYMPAWVEAWLASLWPSSTEPFVLGAVQKLLLQIDRPTSSAEVIASASLLSPLLIAERGWPPTAIYALWLAMFSRDADARAVAIDALVEGLLDGRAHPEPLGEILVEIAAYNWAKLNRLADGLRQVARISPWGALVVSRILDRLIASWQLLPRDAHHILELQLELLLRIHGRLGELARQPLEASSGGGKTAKLAKQLLGLDGSSNSPAYRASLLEGVRLRITHVESIQKMIGGTEARQVMRSTNEKELNRG